jgi:hypothetical protein
VLVSHTSAVAATKRVEHRLTGEPFSPQISRPCDTNLLSTQAPRLLGTCSCGDRDGCTTREAMEEWFGVQGRPNFMGSFDRIRDGWGRPIRSTARGFTGWWRRRKHLQMTHGSWNQPVQLRCGVVWCDAVRCGISETASHLTRLSV